jgi:hypothetical protein
VVADDAAVRKDVDDVVAAVGDEVALDDGAADPAGGEGDSTP